MVTVEVAVGQTAGKNAETGAWYGTKFTNTDLDFTFGRSDNGNTVFNLFFLFPNVTIPDGATIITAYITWEYRSYYGTPPACVLKFEDAADPEVVSSAADGNGRSTTAASVNITGPTSGTSWNSPELKTIIQELVDSYSFAAGANMQCLIFGPAGSGSNYSKSWDSYVTLHIEYTEAKPLYAYAQQ